MKSPSEILAIISRRIENAGERIDCLDGDYAWGQLEVLLSLYREVTGKEYRWKETSESLRDEDVRLDNGQRYRDIKG